MFLVGGMIFGLGMFLFTKLLARYARLDFSPKSKLKRGAHNYLLIAAAIAPSVAILAFALFVQYDFFWAALAAFVGPTLTLVRLPVHGFTRRWLVVRSLLSALAGALAAAAVGFGLLSLEPTPTLIIACLAYGSAWTVAQVIAIAVRPLFQQASA